MKSNPLIVENIEKIKKLKHPNLLEYISVWYEENKNKVVIITELLQGGNLREYRKYQKTIKVKLIKKWIKQLLSALDYLHSNDYIHHDVKCQNILVDRVSGNLKLGDLLCVEKLDNKKYFTKYIGTEEFMAPEVKEGKYSFKADIYSLGLTLIQLITMEKPYKEFQRKIDIYEAKKKGEYPLSFNQIKNREIKNFISLCLKEEKDRPSCKELLTNKWLNDNESPDHHSYLEVVNNLRQQNFKLDKKIFSSNMDSGLINNGTSPFTSSSSLMNPKLERQASMGPIYSLDISKMGYRRGRINSFKLKKQTIYPSIKGVKSLFSLSNLNDYKIKEHKYINSDRTNYQIYRSKSILKWKDSTDLLKQEERADKNLTTIYLYIIELDYNLYCLLKQNQEQNENILFSVKIIISNKKWKNSKLSKENISIEYDYNGEQKSLEIIIQNMSKIIDLTKKEILLIKNKLNGKISKIIKEKKMRDLKDKISKIARNFEFLLNNDEFDYLECLINSKNFDKSKLPKEIEDKIEIYKFKKKLIEKLFSSNGLNINDDYNNNYKLICQEYIIINLLEVEDN